jgi:hypothetical protein
MSLREGQELVFYILIFLPFRLGPSRMVAYMSS